MNENRRTLSERCSDCDSTWTRRHFLAAGAGATVAASLLPALGRHALGAPSPKSDAESAVRRLYDSLTDDQKKLMLLPLADENRSKINANWHITKAIIGETFNSQQQEIITEIVRGVTSEDGFDRFQRQMEDDDGGLLHYAVAIFGNPHEKQFEFELTGRHLTLRADGDTMQGVAFGGPIVYGHGEAGNSSSNLFNYQTKQVNEVFKMLEGAQREKALLSMAPRENDVQLRERGQTLPGIAASELSGDQKGQLRKSLEAVLQPYRKEDVEEVMQIVEAGGGLDKIHLAFYSQEDLGKDKVWDIWRLESPTLVCHFRGAPHVHAYINVARRA